ncbi:MAG: tetratricopeptide repeat protein [Pseudomonadota bacterium]
MRICIALAVLIMAAGLARAGDDAVAWRLFDEGRYAEAAEIFTDPAWKGAAFYRSGQWWRAVEAFVRADDADSFYNLGNAYVRLGYPALALEAYLAALARDPAMQDAAYNADLMRALLAADERKDGKAGLQPEGREIERLDEDTDRSGGASPQTGEGDRQDSASQAGQDPAGNGDGQQADKGDAGSADEADGNRVPDDGQGSEISRLSGQAGDEAAEEETAGGSRTHDEAASSQAAGTRVQLEDSQATRQWLNAIKDDPAAFLDRRIALEMRRRKALGTLPAPGSNPW